MRTFISYSRKFFSVHLVREYEKKNLYKYVIVSICASVYIYLLLVGAKENQY